MSRSCSTCQHLKRTQINQRLAAGEAVSQIARDYDINLSSLYRHKANCLRLASSNEIKKEAAQGSAAVALIPSKEHLSGLLLGLIPQIDDICAEAREKESLQIALSGYNSIRHTIDSLARLAGHLQPAGPQVNVSVQNNTVTVTAAAIAERLIQNFPEPEIRARIAQTLSEDSHETPT
jgi:hypothetical protein